VALGSQSEKENVGGGLLLSLCFFPLEVRGKSLGDLFSLANKGLDTFLKLAAWQQHTVVAPAAFEADIGP
jgi:hypothetical protein